MKRLIVLSLIMAGMVLMAGYSTPIQAQSPVHEGKPTFYKLTPGVYVNGWPRFTMAYPKDWVEEHPFPGEVFRATPPGGGLYSSFLAVVPAPSPLPFDKFADLWVSFCKTIGTDVTVASDKPSRLRDGTPAREVEIQTVANGTPLYIVALGTMRGDLLVNTCVGSRKKIGEDLKGILYSLQYEPGKDEPVAVPADIKEFLDKYSSDMLSHDLTKVMTYYSDRYAESGMNKGEVERNWRQAIGSITSYEIRVTDFEAAGDKVYLAGFTNSNWGKRPLRGTSIIKENGEWKWYGNQREVIAPLAGGK